MVNNKVKQLRLNSHTPGGFCSNLVAFPSRREFDCREKGGLFSSCVERMEAEFGCR